MLGHSCTVIDNWIIIFGLCLTFLFLSCCLLSLLVVFFSCFLHECDFVDLLFTHTSHHCKGVIDVGGLLFFSIVGGSFFFGSVHISFIFGRREVIIAKDELVVAIVFGIGEKAMLFEKIDGLCDRRILQFQHKQSLVAIVLDHRLCCGCILINDLSATKFFQNRLHPEARRKLFLLRRRHICHEGKLGVALIF